MLEIDMHYTMVTNMARVELVDDNLLKDLLRMELLNAMRVVHSVVVHRTVKHT